MRFLHWLLGKKIERPCTADRLSLNELRRNADQQTWRDLAGGRIECFANSIGMKFRRIPAGKFGMGCNEWKDFEKPLHTVTIARHFYMGVCPVAQHEWERVMGDNPSKFKGANRPVEGVSWAMAHDCCRKLSEADSLPYRLPTESEWEYACRAGTTTAYFFGDSSARLGEYAWFDGNRGDGTRDVGKRRENPWGLFDMYGNVFEWCEDVWHPNYGGAPIDGSAWIDGGEQDRRVARGGSPICDTWSCRSASRGGSNPESGWMTGCRIVLAGF